MITYRRDESIHPCHLTREELIRLVEIVKTDFPDSSRKEDFEIGSNWDKARISDNSINDFLSHTNLPPVLSRLNIRLIGWSEERHIDKSVEITFYDNFIQVVVSGHSESWVNGKFIQIVDFLRTARPLFWFLESPPVYALRGALWIIILAGTYWLWKEILYGGSNSPGVKPILLYVLVLFLDWALSRLKYTQIFLADKKSFVQKYNDLFIVVGFIAGIIAIVDFCLRFVSRI